MTEFLTENGRRSYPLDGDWPSGMRERWAGVLADACVYASGELGDARPSLLSVSKGGGALTFSVGIPGGASLDVPVPSGLAGFVTVFAGSPALKAILTVNGERADAIIDDEEYLASGTPVNVPFAARCSGGGVKRVTAITAQGARQCERPQYSASDPHRVTRTVASGAHATLKAWDGVDMDVTTMAPLKGDILRISAIAAPESAEGAEEPIDIMIRGDECFAVEAEPDPDRTKGTIRIRNACKPCCQCEDYADAVNMLKPAEDEVWAVNGDLDGIVADYNAALAAFNEAKALAEAAINSAGNVRVSATAVLSSNAYSGATAATGSRKRISVTLLAENATMTEAEVAVGNDGGASGFAVSGYSLVGTAWTHASGTATRRANGDGRPVTRTLGPGDTLTVTSVYARNNDSNAANPNRPTRPANMKAYCTVTIGGAATLKTIDVK